MASIFDFDNSVRNDKTHSLRPFAATWGIYNNGYIYYYDSSGSGDSVTNKVMRCDTEWANETTWSTYTDQKVGDTFTGDYLNCMWAVNDGVVVHVNNSWSIAADNTIYLADSGNGASAATSYYIQWYRSSVPHSDGTNGMAITTSPTTIINGLKANTEHQY